MSKDILKKVKVLYVEDEQSVREVLGRSLERKVAELYVASDGQDGYNQYLIHQPDIIITDIKMPNMDGLEMTKLIRQKDLHIPIIVTSAHSEAGNFLQAIELGVTNYLLKPLDKDKLFTMLEHNAKTVLYEREKKAMHQLFQEVINLQPSIVFSSNKKEVLFANHYFFDFFSFHISDENFHKYSAEIYKTLQNNQNIMLEVNDQYESWIDYIIEHPNQNFKLRVTKENKMYFFNVKTKAVNINDENSVVILLNESV